MGEAIAIEPVAIARLIRAAVLKVPGVAGISPGTFGLAGTFGEAVLVPGVAVSLQSDRLELEIHIVASMPITTSLPNLADQLRGNIRAMLAELPLPPVGQIDIAVDDLQDEERQG